MGFAEEEWRRSRLVDRWLISSRGRVANFDSKRILKLKYDRFMDEYVVTDYGSSRRIGVYELYEYEFGKPPAGWTPYLETGRVLPEKYWTGKVYCSDTHTVYKNATEAAYALGVSVTSVCAVCKGERQHVSGYHFSRYPA